MTPTEERMKVLDFVEYVKMGNALLTKNDNPQKIDYTNLCGKRVAVLTGSYQLTVRVPDMNAECEAAGLKSLETQQFQDTRQAVSSIVSDRSDVVFADGPILHFAASQSPDVEVVAEAGIDPVAVGIPKDSGMLEAVKAAMDVILKSDEYKEVLGAYGVESIAIDDAKVNVPQ